MRSPERLGEKVGSSSANENSREHAVNIRCPKCSNKGTLIWDGAGKSKFLVRITGEFYERLARTPPHAIELVCQKCGNAQME